MSFVASGAGANQNLEERESVLAGAAAAGTATLEELDAPAPRQRVRRRRIGALRRRRNPTQSNPSGPSVVDANVRDDAGDAKDLDQLLEDDRLRLVDGALTIDTAKPQAALGELVSIPLDSAHARELRGSIATRRPAYLFAKRLMDLIGSSMGLVLASPVMAILALAIKLTSRGPVFYCHTRVGYLGREFTCHKFRTMVRDADKIKADLEAFNSHSDNRTFKIPNDPRVTRIGRWMRRTSLDELPQLFDVFRGDMSLVGPRPALPVELERYTPSDKRRLAVKPGLTCIWQVSGRSLIAFPEQLEMDVEYIRQQSIWTDVKLIAKTIPAVLSADGAY